MNKSIRILWAAVTAALLVLGAAIAVVFWQAYPLARRLVDPLAKDGSMDSFTPVLYARLQLPARALAPVLILLGLGCVFFRPRAEQLLHRVVVYLRESLVRWGKDFGPLGASIKTELAGFGGWTGVFLLAVFALGLGLRWVLILRPMLHDESYTYEAFASESFKFITTNYHLPNNHVFHTILVFLSTRLLGIAPWAVRFPAFLAGGLAVPFGYWLARRLYGPAAAALSAGLIAVLPVLLDYSTNARGYTLVALFTLLILLLALYVKEHRNLAAWSLLVVTGALGFYTVPIMLYPFGGVLAWLFFSALVGDFGGAYSSRWVVIRYLAAAGALTVTLAGVLYLPIIRTMGLHALVGNSFVQSLSWNDFRQTALSRLQDTWREWSTCIPDPGLVFGLGFLLSLGLHSRISRVRFPLQLAVAAWIAAALLIQRPNPWPKIWLFLVPLVMIWVSAGLLAPFQLFHPHWLRGRSLAVPLAALLALAVCVGGTAATLASRTEIAGPSSAESVALFLKPRLQPADVVVVQDPDDAALWYYLRLHGIPQAYVHGIKNRPFDGGYVVVNEQLRQTVSGVIGARGPDLVFFNLTTAREVAQFGAIAVYRVDAYPDRVAKAYGTQVAGN